MKAPTPITDAVMESPNWPWHITERMRKMEIEMYYYHIRAREAEAEVERLQMELDGTCNAEELRQCREERKKAEARVDHYAELINKADDKVLKLEAEIERLKKRPYGCKCETMREKMLGDGCDECNKQLAIEYLQDSNDELEKTIETLVKMAKDLAYLARTHDNKQSWDFIDKCWEQLRDIQPDQFTDETDI